MIRWMGRVLGLGGQAGSPRKASARGFTPCLEVLGDRTMPSAGVVAALGSKPGGGDEVARLSDWPPPPGQVTITGGLSGGVVLGGASGGVIGDGGAPGGVLLGGAAGGIADLDAAWPPPPGAVLLGGGVRVGSGGANN